MSSVSSRLDLTWIYSSLVFGGLILHRKATGQMSKAYSDFG